MEEVFAGYDGAGEPLQYTDVYRFDLVGNRLEKTHDAESDGQIDGTIEYEYDLNDRVLAETQDWLNAALDRYLEYAYGPDNSGTEQTRETVYEGLTADPQHKLKITEYEYNLQGRLAQVEIDSDANGTADETIVYTCNASGIRVTQSIDSATGLQYLRARYYNPKNGRFTQSDPFPGLAFAPGTLHRHGYAHGDPINATDPSGRMAAFGDAELDRRARAELQVASHGARRLFLENLGKLQARLVQTTIRSGKAIAEFTVRAGRAMGTLTSTGRGGLTM